MYYLAITCSSFKSLTMTVTRLPGLMEPFVFRYRLKYVRPAAELTIVPLASPDSTGKFFWSCCKAKASSGSMVEAFD